MSRTLVTLLLFSLLSISFRTLTAPQNLEGPHHADHTWRVCLTLFIGSHTRRYLRSHFFLQKSLSPSYTHLGHLHTHPRTCTHTKTRTISHRHTPWHTHDYTPTHTHLHSLFFHLPPFNLWKAGIKIEKNPHSIQILKCQLGCGQMERHWIPFLHFLHISDDQMALYV